MKHTVEQYMYECGCREAGCMHNLGAEVLALNTCVDDFATILKARLSHHSSRTGKVGWDDPLWSRDEIIKRLKQNADEGDMIDVAAFAMFAWNQE